MRSPRRHAESLSRERAPQHLTDDAERLHLGFAVALGHAVDLEHDDGHGSERAAGGRDLLLYQHREVLLVVEAGRGVERVLVLLGRERFVDRSELGNGCAPAGLLRERGVDRGQLPLDAADLVFGGGEAVLALAGPRLRARRRPWPPSPRAPPATTPSTAESAATPTTPARARRCRR